MKFDFYFGALGRHESCLSKGQLRVAEGNVASGVC